MNSLYTIERMDNSGEVTIDLANFNLVTEVLDNTQEEISSKKFFNVILGNGASISISSNSEQVLLVKRTQILKARKKFTKEFYKTLSRRIGKIITKEKKKYIKKELKLLKEIRNALNN